MLLEKNNNNVIIIGTINSNLPSSVKSQKMKTYIILKKRAFTIIIIGNESHSLKKI